MIKSNFFLVFLLLFAFILRIYGINWDQGFHLHPDERALIMVTERIHFFNQLNPDFFNYGSLPIYLLKGVSQLLDSLFSTEFNTYQGMLYVGRFLSIIFDIGTVLLVYKVSGLLFKNKKIQLYSTFFYAIAFFPIQNSHFFVVDVFLTFFTTLFIYLLFKYVSQSVLHGRHVKRCYNIKLVMFLGIVFATMLATKFTAIIFLPIITLILVLNNLKKIKNLIGHLSIFYLLSSIFFFIFMPYAFIEYKRFFSDISAQIKMNSDPYIFPYTLQYVGTLPYLYYLKNIFLWGLGPIISILSLTGFCAVLISKIKNQKLKLQFKIKNFLKLITIHNHQLVFFFFIYLFYFIVIGRSSVKFMRYMLPIYPFFAIMAGVGLNYLFALTAKRQFARFLATLGMTGGIVGITAAVIWSIMFVNIYSQKHTRVAATEWILKNIPYGSTLALEHWDDGLPLRGGENYNFVELTLYDQPDDESKWQLLNQKLQQADYMIIASNRLYVPLQKLFDCSKYKSCYPKTAEYYRKLFSNTLVIPSDLERVERVEGESRNLFKKVGEFTVYPKLSINNYQLTINDDTADESFTVYDHPKIYIFKKS